MWISVNNQLPEIDEYVLWVNECANMTIFEIDKDFDFIDYNNCLPYKFTHWMKLPEPPKELLP